MSDKQIHQALNDLAKARNGLSDLLSGGRLADVWTREATLQGGVAVFAGALQSLRRLTDLAREGGADTEKVRLATEAVGAFEAALPEKGADFPKLVMAARLITGGRTPLTGMIPRALSAKVSQAPSESVEQDRKQTAWEDLPPDLQELFSKIVSEFARGEWFQGNQVLRHNPGQRDYAMLKSLKHDFGLLKRAEGSKKYCWTELPHSMPEKSIPGAEGEG